MNPATVHLVPLGGRFNSGQKRGATPGTIERVLKTGAAQPGPGQYRIKGTLRQIGGTFSEGNPKSDVEWMIHRAKHQPGPGEYTITASSTGLIGSQPRGKFNEGRGMTYLEQKIRTAQTINPDGATMDHADFETSGGKFNMSNPKTDFDFLLDRGAKTPGPASYDAPRWPAPAVDKSVGPRHNTVGKLDRYRTEGRIQFPKQRLPIRRARSLTDVNPLNSTVTAVQSNWLRPEDLGFGTQKQKQARSATGAKVLARVSKFIEDNKLKMADVFYIFDKDGSGDIDPFEMQDAMVQLGINLNEEEVIEAMKEVDSTFLPCLVRDRYKVILPVLMVSRSLLQAILMGVSQRTNFLTDYEKSWSCNAHSNAAGPPLYKREGKSHQVSSRGKQRGLAAAKVARVRAAGTVLRQVEVEAACGDVPLDTLPMFP